MATYGLVFFATPHKGGSFAAIGSIFAKLARKACGNPANDFMTSLTKESFTAERFDEEFRLSQGNLKVLSFYETKRMPKVGLVSCTPVDPLSYHMVPNKRYVGRDLSGS